jgi:hypothetical protein
MIVGSAHDVGIRVGRRVGRDPAKVEAHRKASRESMRRLRRRRRHRMYMKLRRSAESVWAKLPWDVRLRENRLDWMRVKMRELRRTIE